MQAQHSVCACEKSVCPHGLTQTQCLHRDMAMSNGCPSSAKNPRHPASCGGGYVKGTEWPSPVPNQAKGGSHTLCWCGGPEGHQR